jgi:hypothetical protein
MLGRHAWMRLVIPSRKPSLVKPKHYCNKTNKFGRNKEVFLETSSIMKKNKYPVDMHG